MGRLWAAWHILSHTAQGQAHSAQDEDLPLPIPICNIWGLSVGSDFPQQDLTSDVTLERKLNLGIHFRG